MVGDPLKDHKDTPDPCEITNPRHVLTNSPTSVITIPKLVDHDTGEIAMLYGTPSSIGQRTDMSVSARTCLSEAQPGALSDQQVPNVVPTDNGLLPCALVERLACLCDKMT